MTSLFANWRTTIRLTVVTAAVITTMMTIGLATGLQYHFGQALAKDAAADLYTASAAGIAGELRGLSRLNANIIDLLDDNPVLQDRNQHAAHLDIFTDILKQNPLLYGIYLGDRQGNLFEVINLGNSERARKKLRALPTDRWAIMRVSPSAQGATRSFEYLDEKLESRFIREEPTDYDVRTRPWYRSAIESHEVQITAPYLFDQLGMPGRTVSKRIPGTDTVIAMDMTLATIADFLRQSKISEHGDVFLFDADGRIIASDEELRIGRETLPVPELALSSQETEFIASQPVLRVSNELDWPPIDYTQSGTPSGYSIDVVRLIGEMTGLQFSFVNGHSWEELVQLFRQGEIDLLQPVFMTAGNRKLGLEGESFMPLPHAVATHSAHAALTDLSQLGSASLAIPEGWSIIPIIREHLPEIEIIEAASTHDALKMVLTGTASAALDSEAVMRYVAETSFLQGLAYHSEVNIGKGTLPDRLHIVVHKDRADLRRILDKAIAAIGPEQRAYLDARWLTYGDEGETLASGMVPSQSLIDMAANTERHNQLAEIRHNNSAFLAYAAPVSGSDTPLYMGVLAPKKAIVAPFLDKVRLSILITGAFLLLVLPLSWFLANPIVRPIRQLAQENRKVQLREYSRVKRVDTAVVELDELSDSMVSMVAAIQAHEIAQRKLMDSFIELIAQAIDDKSSYTGGHCKRVPELAIMLAEHASASDLPAFRDFRLENDDAWREFRIAAWLHDCGKITTPEHIVDKGSKLETIYNRIHEVRMRFEVLWRDAQIEHLQSLLAKPDERPGLEQKLAERHRQLQDDFLFVAECNVGGEFLAEEQIERLREIGRHTWQRFFDDRVGLSPLEELRSKGDSEPLPATEQLLSDKPEHIIRREQSTDYPPALGIDMDIPEHLYNLGEIYNLSVSRGTLTAEDRFKINEHMISTIKMLESLPFPEELKNVPRYASTHHETMKGSGYPRKLPGEELSTAERLLAIADIFEALTASDRPYKKAKSVSSAIEIMHNMVLENHIDRDCFELFLREGIYLRYARGFLPESQCDPVDAARFLGAA